MAPKNKQAKPKKPESQFPKRLYAMRAGGDDCFHAYPSLYGFDTGEEPVAVYALERVGRVKTTTTWEPTGAGTTRGKTVDLDTIEVAP